MSVTDAFNNISAVDPVVEGQVGAVQVTVHPGGNINKSTYNDKSFTVENIGDKRIAAIYFDITDALFTDAVFDPYGEAGDTAARDLTFSSTGNTGAETPGTFYGEGGTLGFEGMRMTFDPTVSNGYDPGEIVQFGVDLDPNSIVGLPKNPTDINGDDPTLNNWDMGGISGAELLNTQVHVLFTDGTTAVGELIGDGSQGGSAAVASQASPNQDVTLTVNGIAEGGSGSYTQSDIQVLISGATGETARVGLVQGFIQPFDYIDPDGNEVYLSEKFIGSPFPANQALQFQTVDVSLDGTVQDITSQFNFTAPGGTLAFPGDDTLPIGFVASTIDANQLPTGPVSEPIYLTHAEAGTDTAPPTATLSASDITASGATEYSFTVSYTDASGIDTTTLDINDVTVVSSTGVALTVTGVTDNGDGSATYTVSAPGGDWDETDNDTYTVTLQGGEVADTLGNTSTGQQELGSFAVNISGPDTDPPTATLSASDITASGATEYSFTVSYTDASGIDTTTLDINDVTVASSAGVALTVTGVTDNGDGSATYTVSTPGGDWDETDNDTYTVTLQGGEVADTLGNTSTGQQELGSFAVDIGTPLPAGSTIRMEAEDYKPGTNGVEYQDFGGRNVGGEYRLEEPVDITTSDDVDGNYQVGWIRTDEWLTYDVSPAAGIYDIKVRVKTDDVEDSFTITAGGQSFTETFGTGSTTGGWQDVVISGVTLGGGAQEIRIDMNTDGFDFNYIELIPSGPVGNTAPTTSGIADVTVDEGSANTVIPLFDAFEDAEDPDEALTYAIIENTDGSIFETTPTINSTTGELTLDYVATGTGSSELTVRATDTEGLSTSTTFTATVIDPTANTAPTTSANGFESGVADVTVDEGSANTVIPLFDAFEDAEDPDSALTYEVVGNTNTALFETAPSIDPTTGELTLDYVPTGTGSSDLTVRVTDTGGLFVEDLFKVTVNALPTGDGIRMEAEDYKPGTNGVEYQDFGGRNVGGEYRLEEPVDITTSDDVDGNYQVGWIRTDEWLTYDVSPAAGIYDIKVRVKTDDVEDSFTITAGGQSFTETFGTGSTTGGWQDVVIPGVTLGGGAQEIRIDMNTDGFDFNYIELIPAGPDETAPTAALGSANLELLVDSTAAARFTIDYDDNVAIESTTLDSQDIQVTAPDGTVLTTSFVSVSPTGDSASPTATYAIAAPTGGWQFTDSGTYTVDILADQVTDTSGNVLATQSFDLGVTVNDPPATEGIPDLVVPEGAADRTVDLFAAFEDAQDTDDLLSYAVSTNTNGGLVSTAIAGGDLTLDYATSGTGASNITVQATDTDGTSTDTTFTATVITPQGNDGTIRINAGGGDVYDAAGNLFAADANFSGGQATSTASSNAIANTKADAIYQTQREGGQFSYSIPVPNGNYILNAHIVDWESTDFNQRVFDMTVEGQSFYPDLDIYSEIKNAFLDGTDTAKIINGPDKNTTVVASVSDGTLDVNFDASSGINNATIAALEVVPLDQPGVLIQETDDFTQISEGVAVDSYSVVLTAPPTGDVTVNLNYDSSQLTTDIQSLSFDSTNWNQPRTVTVTPIDDTLPEGPHIESIGHAVSATAGSNYESITSADDVSVTILDNDVSESAIGFDRTLIATPDRPTAGAFGPDGRLYVSSITGHITVYTLNDDYTIDTSKTEVIDVVANQSNNDITGIAFNPFDIEPKIYVSHNEFYANGGYSFPSTEFSPFSGQVSVLEKINGTWELDPLVTGIGVSNHNHGVNGLEFDHNGDLYITSGSNTNAGIIDTAIGGLDESPFTAAILKADIADAPGVPNANFNGNIDYTLIAEEDLIQPVPQEFLDSLPPEIFNPPSAETLGFDPADSQFWGGYVDPVPGIDVSVYASGFRNPYDMILTTSGLLYATENNANANFGDESTGPYTQVPFGDETPEELNLVVEGAYYGFPNRSRGRTDYRQNIYYDGPTDSPTDGYTAPIGEFLGSTNGIAEYRATAFGGQLRGDLLAQQYKGKLYSIDLSADGQQTDEIVDLNKTAIINNGTESKPFAARGLDVLTGPGGAIIGLDYARDELTVAVPNENLTGPTAYDIYPWRAPIQGGADFIIGGVNFDTDPGDTKVFIGDQESTAVEVTGLNVSPTRIRGTLPDLSSQPSQLLDIFIKDANNNLVSFIDDAFMPLA